MKDGKYLLAYILPLTVFLSLYYRGIWAFSAILLTFVVIPLLELVLPYSKKNLSEEEEKTKSRSLFFDLLLYLNVPILYGLLLYYFHIMSTASLSIAEVIGLTMSIGISVSSLGINVGHELGHRSTWYELLFARMLLLTGLYMHFTLEHNWGHHKNVATDEDPASARLNEPIYTFLLRSSTGGYLHAWKLEANRLRKTGRSITGVHNQMIWFQVIQLTYLLSIGIVFGWSILLYAIAVAVIGFLLLESVNYIEHYGLRRRKLPSGRYEQVLPTHSWNSDHELGRIFLYELTRHSDHHYKATRKYQVLRHFNNSPQLPFGYPGAILLSMIPPLWFKTMNKKVNSFQSSD